MKKRVVFCALALAAALLLVGCGQGSKDTGMALTQDQIKETAHAAVTKLNEKDYDGFQALLQDELKTLLPPETLKSAVDQVMPNAGAFQSFIADKLSNQKDENGNPCVVDVLTVQYENQKVAFSITVNEDNQIIGFYLK